MEELVCDLNLALTPDETLASRHIALSEQMAKSYRAVIELNSVTRRLAFIPHLTVYQVRIKIRDLPALYAGLANVSAKTAAFSLAATEYGFNGRDATFEVRYEAASRLMRLQDDVLAVVNPMRGDLLMERDPAGHPFSELIAQSGTVGDNIRRTGFDAVGDPAKGGTFQPHVTINWFEPGTSVDLTAPDVPRVSDFDGRFVALGIFVLGPYGTCVQRLAAMDLAG